MSKYTPGQDNQSVDDRTRRRFLQLSGLAGFVALAGCGSDETEVTEQDGSGSRGDGNNNGNSDGDGADTSSDGNAGGDDGDSTSTSTPAFAEDTFVLLTGAEWDDVNANFFNGPYTHTLRQILLIHGAQPRMSGANRWIDLLWKNWETSFDPNQLEIELNDTTFWSAKDDGIDGKQVTAEDWKFTQEMYRFQSGNEMFDDGIEQIEILDEKTLRLHSANKRTGAVLSQEFANWNEIAPKAEPYLSFYERFQDAGTDSEMQTIREDLLDLRIPIGEGHGTGPWKINDVSSKRIKAVANEGYFGRNDPGGLDFSTFEIRSIPEANLAKQTLLNDKLDGGDIPNPTNDIDGLLPDDVNRFETVDPGGHGLVFNHGDDALTSDPDLRVAFSHMMDYSQFAVPSPMKYKSVEGTYFSGMPAQYAGDYLTDEMKNNLVDYMEPDHERAEEHLGKTDLEKDGDTWYEPNGDEFQIDVSCSQSRISLGRGVSKFLNDFGINAQVVTGSDSLDITEGTARVHIWDWGATGTNLPIMDYNVYYLGWMSESYNGLNETEVVDVPPVGNPTGERSEYPIVERIKKAKQLALNNSKYREIINELAWAYNSLMPTLPLAMLKNQFFMDTKNFQFVGDFQIDGNLADTLRAPHMMANYTGSLAGKRE